jgi:ectoine hydroxylase-related dioxygenase (phytanoyl-CoA dioxygenase family)
MPETMTVPVVEADATPDEVAAVLAQVGCVVVSHLAPLDTMDRIRAELDPFIEATRFGRDDFSGHHTRRTGSLIARSPTFRDLAVHPIVIGALDQVLGDHATNYQLHLTQIIDIGPGESGQMIHRDQWAFDFFSFPQGFEVECHTMWAMTDFTEANGATRVIPGSNHWEDKLRPGYDETVPAEMEKGSVMLYVGSLYHGGGANTTDQRRLGINVGYTLAWLRQEENQYLACPPEVARELPVELARLMGYSRAAYALGYWGDTRDPMEYLHPSAGTPDGFAALG